MKATPIKRHKALQPLSRDHHRALLLCWKIRTGLSKGIAPERIKKYAGWFSENHLEPHFEMEEQHLFPLLDKNHDGVKKALADHRRIERLLESNSDLAKSLMQIADELESHIRFEERILFNEIQKVADEKKLAMIESLHSESHFCDNEEDGFWK